MAIGRLSEDIKRRLEDQYSVRLSSVEIAELFSNLISERRDISDCETGVFEESVGEFLEFHLIQFDGSRCQLKSFPSLTHLRKYGSNRRDKQITR